MGDGIVEFGLDEQILTVIKGPPGADGVHYKDRQVIQAEDGALGFSTFLYPHLQMWQRNVNALGVATWVPWKTIEIHSILGLPAPHEEMYVQVLSYDEDDVLFF
jgi:hypothetical protein